jgi:hypothetical protein
MRKSLILLFIFVLVLMSAVLTNKNSKEIPDSIKTGQPESHLSNKNMIVNHRTANQAYSSM